MRAHIVVLADFGENVGNVIVLGIFAALTFTLHFSISFCLRGVVHHLVITAPRIAALRTVSLPCCDDANLG